MGTISKNFDFAEFEATSYSQYRAQNKITDPAVRDNIAALVNRVLQPLRDAWGAPLTINSGYRCEALNKAVGGVATSQHCLDDKTEILTLSGWKGRTDIKEGDMIFSYSIEKGEIEVVPVDEMVSYGYCGKMMKLQNRLLDVCVTPEHRMMLRTPCHKYVRRGTNKISESGQRYFDSLKTDNDKYHIETAAETFGKRRLFLNAGLLSNDFAQGVDEYTLDLYKLAVAVIADGCFTRSEGRLNGIVFTLKKERKIKYIKALLTKMEHPFTVNTRKYDGATIIWVNSKVARPVHDLIGDNKFIPASFVTLPRELQKALVYEYAFYDGHKDLRKNCCNMLILTTNKENADIIQAMCVLSGMRTSIGFRPSGTYCIRGKTGPQKATYHLNICPKRVETKASECDYEWVDYEGEVWCANNRNTTLITRRNGKVAIIGNCKGEAADVASPDPYSLAGLAQALELPYDQMILYPTFVHFSHKREGLQRGQILYNSSYKGGRL